MATTYSNCNKTPRPHSLLGPAMHDTRLQVSFPSWRKAPKIQFTLTSRSKVRPHHTDTDTRGMLSCVDRKNSHTSRGHIFLPNLVFSHMAPYQTAVYNSILSSISNVTWGEGTRAWRERSHEKFLAHDGQFLPREGISLSVIQVYSNLHRS